jgi:hypothetical protein
MKKKKVSTTPRERSKKMNDLGNIYGLALIGAVVYYIRHAVTFWGGVLGFFKAVFWPAMLMYKLLELLKM